MAWRFLRRWVSEITADLDGGVKVWQTRRLDVVWPTVFLEGIIVHIRGESGRVSQHTKSSTFKVRPEYSVPWP